MKINNLCLECMKAEYSSTGICPVCGSRQGFANQDHQLVPSSILNGKYLVGRAIGQGGFGITYVGFDLKQQRKVAIKEFFPSQFATRSRDNHTVSPYTGNETEKIYKEECDKFYKEAQKLREFRDVPNVVSVLDCFSENNTAYIVMEYIEGQTLKDYLNNLNMKMRFEDITSLLEPIMTALIHIHARKVIHRDVSPDNIILSGARIMLVDFGSARVMTPGKALTVNIKGGYTPQEQYDEKGKQGAWTDVYALGATIYRAVTGIVPFNAQGRSDVNDLLQRPRMLNPEITPEEEAVLLKALAIQWEDRYRSIEEFWSAIKNLNVPASTPDPTPPSEFTSAPAPEMPDHPAATVISTGKDNQKALRPAKMLAAGVLMILTCFLGTFWVGYAHEDGRIIDADLVCLLLFSIISIGLSLRSMITWPEIVEKNKRVLLLSLIVCNSLFLIYVLCIWSDFITVPIILLVLSIFQYLFSKSKF